MFHYACSLGNTTNNIVEAYTLYPGLKLAKEYNIFQLSIFGDSMLIFMEFLKRHYMKNNLLSGIINQIISLISNFE
jgi:ribonuclease HI